MNKKCKELLKSNIKREKEIHGDNAKIYSNMIVYLRSADMSRYNQKLVREDLIEMIVDDQNRGDDINKVMGNNYKEICDDIMEAVPRKTKREKIAEVLEISLSGVWILGIIYIGKVILENLITKIDSWVFTLYLGDIVNMGIIVLSANLVVYFLSKNAFKTKEKAPLFHDMAYGHYYNGNYFISFQCTEIQCC
ncbi:hypothetical protein [Clostridium culturomicium]|uniref:hypothetical protein n=1 Tax=Clostridium culturomicium TaxID=1499683 RepID=UPI000694D149|nr:hypothetical protein [Clostridium culturomicium]